MEPIVWVLGYFPCVVDAYGITQAYMCSKCQVMSTLGLQSAQYRPSAVHI